MSSAIETISMLLPKLSPGERRQVRSLLEQDEYEVWKKQTAKFRQAMKDKAKDLRPASKVVSEGRR